MLSRGKCKFYQKSTIILMTILLLSTSWSVFADHNPSHLQEESEKREKFAVVVGIGIVALLLISASSKIDGDDSNSQDNNVVNKTKNHGQDIQPFVTLYDSGNSYESRHQYNAKNTGLLLGVILKY